jgi:hypothetical protein
MKMLFKYVISEEKNENLKLQKCTRYLFMHLGGRPFRRQTPETLMSNHMGRSHP